MNDFKIHLINKNQIYQLNQFKNLVEIKIIHHSKFSNWFQNLTNPSSHIIHYRDILNCQLSFQHNQTQIHLTFLKTNHQRKQTLQTLNLIGQFNPTPDSNHNTSKIQIQSWVDTLMLKSYPVFEGMPSTRSILIIINPASGSKKSLKIWSDIVEPILKSSTAKYQVIFTKHAGHAAEIAQNLNLDKYHVVSCISGDGLIHEFLNGLGSRKSDFAHAMNKITLTSIPAGSGNALSTNHIGPEQAINIHLATLNLLKGRPTRIDLCSMTQLDPNHQIKGTGSESQISTIRRFCFLSVSFGLMADLDIGTEALRWIGSTRFILGFIWGAIRNKPHRIRLDLQLVQNHKDEIANTFYHLRDKIKKEFINSSDQIISKIDQNPHLQSNNDDDEHVRFKSFDTFTGLPKLKYGDVGTHLESTSSSLITRNEENDSTITKQRQDDGWITIETDVVSLYAGILPFMSNDLLQFPAKIPGMDSSIHLALHRPTSIWASLALLIGAESGQIYKNQTVEFYKVKAFRLTPLSGNKKLTTKQTQTQTATRSQSTDIRKNDLNRNDNVIPKVESKIKDKCHIALDGESLPFSPLQLEIHDRLLRTLSLLPPDNSPYFGSIGVPERII